MAVNTPDYQREVWADAHPLPSFDVPDGWYENGSMRNHNGTERSLRSADWRYHIDLAAVPRLGTAEGPYTATLKVQVGGTDSFETRSIHRLTAIEPGAVQGAVYLLVGRAVEHELGGGAE